MLTATSLRPTSPYSWPQPDHAAGLKADQRGPSGGAWRERSRKHIARFGMEGGCGATFVESLRLQRFIALGDQAIG